MNVHVCVCVCLYVCVTVCVSRWHDTRIVAILIPRPFPSPVFDCLQYANMEGKAWEIWSRVVMPGRWRVDTRGWRPTIIIPFSCQNVPGIVNDEWY